MARPRTRRAFRGSSRKFVWARKIGGGIVGDSGFVTDMFDDFRAAYGADILGSTIERVRGVIFWNANNLTLDGIHAVAGLRVADEGNLSASTNEPPLAQPHADWMMWDATVLDDGSPGNYLNDRRTIDVKAARKLEELGQTLMLGFEHDAVGSSVEVRYNLSMGLKLP